VPKPTEAEVSSPIGAAPESSPPLCERQSAFAPARCSSRLSEGSNGAAPLGAASSGGVSSRPERPARRRVPMTGRLYVRHGGSAVRERRTCCNARHEPPVRAANGQEVALDHAAA